MPEDTPDYDINDKQPDTVVLEEGKREWFSQIPNLVCEMNLTPYEMTAYIYFKKIAGDHGACWKHSTRLAEDMRMSTGSLSKAKQGLVRKGLIVIQPITEPITIQGHELKPQGRGKPAHLIRIIDIWELNKQVFLGLISLPEINLSSHEIIISQGEIKKIPLKKNPSKKKRISAPEDGAPAPDETEPPPKQKKKQDAQPENSPQSQDSGDQNSNGSGASDFDRIKAGVVWASEGITPEQTEKNRLLFENGKKRKEIMRVTKLLADYGIDPDNIYKFVRDYWPTHWKYKNDPPQLLPKPCDIIDDWLAFERGDWKNSATSDDPMDRLLARQGVTIDYGH
jgi:hypothetical protein